jgi:hypothetical protein
MCCWRGRISRVSLFIYLVFFFFPLCAAPIGKMGNKQVSALYLMANRMLILSSSAHTEVDDMILRRNDADSDLRP